MLEDEIISYGKPKSVVAEAFRALRTNLEFMMSSEGTKTILVTSSHSGEGKSMISANLATVFALQDKKTILIDSDMRKGVQFKKFGLINNNGLSNYLANMNLNEKELIKRTDIPNLFVITCGPVPPNPAELLSLDKMEELLDYLKKNCDVIIIDGAPVLPVTDSVILASKVDKVVIVTNSGNTHKDELKATKAAIDSVNGKIAGVILNNVENKKKSYGHYGKYRKYGDDSYYGNVEEKRREKLGEE